MLSKYTIFDKFCVSIYIKGGEGVGIQKGKLKKVIG